MSLRAVIEVMIHLESFRNIDLFFQGIYYTRLRVSHCKKELLQPSSTQNPGPSRPASIPASDKQPTKAPNSNPAAAGASQTPSTSAPNSINPDQVEYA